MIDSCLECHGWGVTRTYRWLCIGCARWRQIYPVGDCRSCGHRQAVDPGGVCRLCRKQLAHMRGVHGKRVELAEANRDGHQLYFVGMFHRNGQHSRRPMVPPPPPVSVHPVTHRQLVLLELPRDLTAGLRRGFPPPPDPAAAAAWHQIVAEHAQRHGWSHHHIEAVQRGVRIMLGIQDTPGAPIRGSDIMLLTAIGVSAPGVTDVFDQAGMLEEDREPRVVRWFGSQTSMLPEPMRAELEVWFEVMRHGSATPPRFLPRAERTIISQLGCALPTLRAWAKQHPSLREIGRDDILAALPPAAGPRSLAIQSLRSIFRVLKARKLVFVNPTARISVPSPDKTAPPPIDLTALRAALDSPNVTQAALAALLAFHAIRVRQLIQLQLTDLRDGRLHIGEHVIPLAEPVQQRMAAYLDYRQQQWPNTASPYLFINRRSANYTRPATPWWIRKQLGMPGQAIRQDRILDEAHATGGDVRLICELFDLSPAGAYRYAATLDHPAIAEFAPGQPPPAATRADPGSRNPGVEYRPHSSTHPEFSRES